MSLVIARTQKILPNTPLVFDRGEEDFFAISTGLVGVFICEFDDGRILPVDQYSCYLYSIYKCEFAWKSSKKCTVKNGFQDAPMVSDVDVYIHFLEVAK